MKLDLMRYFHRPCLTTAIITMHRLVQPPVLLQHLTGTMGGIHPTETHVLIHNKTSQHVSTHMKQIITNSTEQEFSHRVYITENPSNNTYVSDKTPVKVRLCSIWYKDI